MKLEDIAKPYYAAEGGNSWQHIQQVLGEAGRILQKLKKRELTLSERAAILFHDSAVLKHGKENHGALSAEIARKALTPTKLFDENTLNTIVTAIQEHDDEANPAGAHSSELSDLLASADFNPPDVPWMLNKSYVWGIRHGLNERARLMNTLLTMRQMYGSSGYVHYPAMYSEFYKKEIPKMQKAMDSLSIDSIRRIVQKYRAEHRLGENDITLPVPKVRG